MSRFPVRPKLKQYRGSNEKLERKNRDYNAMAHKVAAHLNGLVANNPNATQQYMFADIAYTLGYSAEEVRSAVSNGEYNGITFQDISDEERRDLEGYKLS